MGTLRMRRSGVEWLGVRYSLAALGAWLLGLPLSLVMAFSFWAQAGYGPAIVGGYVFLFGALSGWFAFVLQRWVDPGHPSGRPLVSQVRRPKGVAALLGGSMILIGLVLIGRLSLSISQFGPSGVLAFLLDVFAGFLVLVGLVGLFLEARLR